MLTELAALALTGLATASPLTTRSSSVVQCRDFYAPITASANNSDYTGIISTPANQQALTQALVDTFAAGSTVMADAAAAPGDNVEGTYTLWFEYCEPTQGKPTGVFQTAHGLVGNAGYWNAKFDGAQGNSFAEAAAAAGWATLSYDRLGVGRSDHPDGLAVVQISYEAAQAVAIGQALREGSLSDVGQFDTIVGVGHSYGSYLYTAVASIAPEAYDAIILTGFTNNATSGPLGLASFDSTIASVAYPSRFSSLSNSYVITPTVSVDQTGFFHYPNYTQGALDTFTTTKGEYSLGQQNSIGAPTMLSRANFTKPVLVVTGDRDGPFCASNCSLTSLGEGMTQLDGVKDLYPAVDASNFSTYVVPDTAHGINFHTTASMAYAQIFNFTTSALGL